MRHREHALERLEAEQAEREEARLLRLPIAQRPQHGRIRLDRRLARRIGSNSSRAFLARRSFSRSSAGKAALAGAVPVPKEKERGCLASEPPLSGNAIAAAHQGLDFVAGQDGLIGSLGHKAGEEHLLDTAEPFLNS
jgi:hypothetical protein